MKLLLAVALLGVALAPAGPQNSEAPTGFDNNLVDDVTHQTDQLRSLIHRDAEHRGLYQVFLDVRDAAARILEHTTLAEVSSISISINNGLLTQLLSIQQLPTQSRFKSHSVRRPPHPRRMLRRFILRTLLRLPFHTFLFEKACSGQA